MREQSLTSTGKYFFLQQLALFRSGSRNIVSKKTQGVEYEETGDQARAEQAAPDPLQTKHDRAQS